MPAVQLGALVALALAASAQDRLASADEVAAAGQPPAAAVLGGLPPTSSVVMGALPTPPGKVVLKTETYGTVTVDHRAHLARRTACRSCHGDGPVGKIAFTPKQAHDTCRACHVDLQKGPTDCTGCHALPPKPQTVVAAAPPSAAAPSGAARPDGAGGPAPAASKAAERGAGSPGSALPASSPPAAVASLDPATQPAAAGLPAPPPPPTSGELEDEPDVDGPIFRQSVQAGMVVRGGGGQSALFGAALELTSRSGRALLVHHLESAGGLRTGRTMLLVGAGAALPVRPRLALMIVGAGGLDAFGADARLLPAAGVRVGLQWTRAIPHVELFSATLSGISDLTRQQDAAGKRIGDVTISLGLAAGFGLDR